MLKRWKDKRGVQIGKTFSSFHEKIVEREKSLPYNSIINYNLEFQRPKKRKHSMVSRQVTLWIGSNFLSKRELVLYREILFFATLYFDTLQFALI
jgi:hypothetical protein